MSTILALNFKTQVLDMHAGIDFGTSNCLISTSQGCNTQAIPLSIGHNEMPSAMYVYKPEISTASIKDARYRRLLEERMVLARQRQISEGSIKPNDEELLIQQQELLERELASAPRMNTHTLADALARHGETRFGFEAIETGFAESEDGFTVKSPKSFLGAKLGADRLGLFTEICSRMLEHIKSRAEAMQDTSIDSVVIGRPVNFHGTNGERGNEQAVAIIREAAYRAGYQHVEFMLEPLAAAVDFEQTLQKDTAVLVVDLGGGTTDCSFLRLGPSYRDKEHDVLAHTGSRIGGLDLDIHLAFAEFMPFFGKGSDQLNGLPMPANIFYDACQVNDINAQRDFMKADLDRLFRNAKEPERFERLVELREQNGSIKLILNSEQAKIQLSQSPQCSVCLDWLEKGFSINVQAERYAEAVQRQLNAFGQLAEEAVKQAGTRPDIIYVTGGTAKSPLIRAVLESALGSNIPLVSGNHFASVVSGLAMEAERLFR